jgi:hypothetical protein
LARIFIDNFARLSTLFSLMLSAILSKVQMKTTKQSFLGTFVRQMRNVTLSSVMWIFAEINNWDFQEDSPARYDVD